MWSDAALLSRDFDEHSFLRHSLHLPTADAEQLRLNRCVEAVEQDIRQMISRSSDQLLSQVDAACAAEKDVAAFRGVVSSLGTSVKRLRHTVDDPHEAIQAKVAELQHNMTILETLRVLQKFLSAVSKLSEFVTSDVARAARTLRDIEEILATNQLQGIEAAEAHMEHVTKYSATIRSSAHEMLKNAVATQNQADIATALQCFYSLNTLHKVVSNVIAEHKRELTKLVMRELDVQTISQSIEQSTSGTEATRTRDIVFGRLDHVIGESLQRMDAVVTLWRILCKKRDPATQELFIDAVKDGRNLVLELWLSVSQQLSERLSKLQKRGNIFLMFVAEFARYLTSARTFVNGAAEILAAIGDKELGAVWMRQVVEDVEQRFIAALVEKHRDKVQQATLRLATIMPTGGAEGIHMDVAVDPARPQLPAAVTALDVKGLTKLIQQEVATHRQDPHLLSIVVKQAQSSLNLVAQRLHEALAKVPPSKAAALGPAGGTAAHMFQFCVANAASSMCQDLTNVLAVLPTESSHDQHDLKAVVRALQDVCGSVLRPHFDAARVALVADVDSAIDDIGGHDGGLQRLTVSVGAVVSRFVLLLDRAMPGLEEESRQLLDALMCRTVAKATLKRPLDEAATQHVVKCLIQMPQVISTIPHLPDVSSGALRNQLKACRTLLTSSGDEHVFRTHAASVNPVLLLLHLVQRTPVSVLPPLTLPAPQNNSESLSSTVCDAVSADNMASRRAVVECVGRAMLVYEQASLDAEGSNRRAWALDVFHALRKTIL